MPFTTDDPYRITHAFGLPPEKAPEVDARLQVIQAMSSALVTQVQDDLTKLETLSAEAADIAITKLDVIAFDAEEALSAFLMQKISLIKSLQATLGISPSQEILALMQAFIVAQNVPLSLTSENNSQMTLRKQVYDPCPWLH